MKKPDPIEMLETVESVKKEADELMMKKIDHYEKEISLVREQAQIDIMTLEKRVAELLKINESHQKLNGELREDNKKLAKQIDDYTNQLRKAGVI
jgi:septal ring factor EnvC (AmiA/AmiB activator)